MEEIKLRNYAHLGDAVWEVAVRERIIVKTIKAKEMHDETTKKVCASYQAKLLKELETDLTQEEQELARRARNLQVPVARRANQGEYRQATAFETLIGWWYLKDKKRLETILTKLNQHI